MTIYLDCNSTSPVDPEVGQLVVYYMTREFGNAGSRTHIYGTAANAAVETARLQIATTLDAQKDEILFTSGATESNNLAILGLADAGYALKKRHIISTQIEHKAVLEPLSRLEQQGFQVSYVKPSSDGSVTTDSVLRGIRGDTLLISVMHVNNETGALQPIEQIATGLEGSEVYFHVDAAQGFGKALPALRHHRIDLMSISGHKVYAPKGIGALLTRRRNFKRPPLSPLLLGGGQEKGLRPGTLPVPLIAGLGLASEKAVQNNTAWWEQCGRVKKDAVEALQKIGARFHAQDNALPNVLNCSVPGVHSEAAIIALKGIAAISNGSACTSSSYSLSHVLKAMGLPDEDIAGALRFSWSPMTEEINWAEITQALQQLS